MIEARHEDDHRADEPDHDEDEGDDRTDERELVRAQECERVTPTPPGRLDDELQRLRGSDTPCRTRLSHPRVGVALLDIGEQVEER